MATVGGSGVAVPIPDPDDDQSVGNGEIVWHLIEPSYYVDDPTSPGEKAIASGTFAHGKSGVSFIRPDRFKSISAEDFVEQYFPDFGVAAMRVVDVRNYVQCLFVIENNPSSIPWPSDAHVCAYASPRQRARSPWAFT
jgi:hypothetical protein